MYTNHSTDKQLSDSKPTAVTVPTLHQFDTLRAGCFPHCSEFLASKAEEYRDLLLALRQREAERAHSQ